MTILIVVGVMDLAAMAIVATAITVERFAPNPERAARAAGILAVAAGALVIIWSTAA
jgi:predicted metal-binding membrane protein